MPTPDRQTIANMLSMAGNTMETHLLRADLMLALLAAVRREALEEAERILCATRTDQSAGRFRQSARAAIHRAIRVLSTPPGGPKP